MITRDQSNRLQMLVEDATQSALNLQEAQRKHKHNQAALFDYIISLEKAPEVEG